MKLPVAISLEAFMTALPSDLNDENQEVIFIRKRKRGRVYSLFFDCVTF